MSLKDLIVYSDDEMNLAITEAHSGSTSAFMHFNPQAFSYQLHKRGYIVVRTQDAIRMTRDDIIREFLAGMPDRLKQAGTQMAGAYEKRLDPFQRRPEAEGTTTAGGPQTISE